MKQPLNILYVVPGTGGSFYCENCMRDCAMITGLRDLGHRVTAVPMYLPLMHEENVPLGDAPLFFGAVRIFLEERFPLLRSFPAGIRHMLDSPAMLSFAASKAGSTRAAGHERMTISMLQGLAGPVAAEFERLVSWALSDVDPDVVFLSNAFLLGVAQAFKARSKVPVACVAQDEHTWVNSSSEAYRQATWDTVGRESEHADVVLSFSAWYAQLLVRSAGIAQDRIATIPFGVDPGRYRVADPSQDPPRVGFLGRLNEDGGMNTLVDAYVRTVAGPGLEHLQLWLCGGYTGDDVATLNRCRRRAESAGVVHVEEKFGLARRTAFLSSLSVLSVPSPVAAALGTFIFEGLAAGVPSVVPDSGGYAEAIQATGGGILYSPNTPEALAEALTSLLSDKARRMELAQSGRQAVVDTYNHTAMARAALHALEKRDAL